MMQCVRGRVLGYFPAGYLIGCLLEYTYYRYTVSVFKITPWNIFVVVVVLVSKPASYLFKCLNYILWNNQTFVLKVERKNEAIAPHVEGDLSKCFSHCPGWCGWVDWACVCKPKGGQFDWQSGCYRTERRVVHDKLLQKGSPFLSLEVPPPHAHLLGSQCPPQEESLSMPETGEKERNYLFKSYTDLE